MVAPRRPAVVGLAGRLAPELLGRGVAGRAGRAAVGLAGGPGVLEVDDDDAAVVGHQDVVGVEVADDDPGGVEGGQRLGQRRGQPERSSAGGSGAAGPVSFDDLPERSGVDVLLDQEHVAALLEDLDEPGRRAERLDDRQHAGLVADPGPGVAVAVVAHVGAALLDDDERPVVVSSAR